ncbi:MAG: hypothetical protein KF862_12915 [Chitinophagaceae bacterium]|nr:hypothetical protein [Chitinophagaceae bacterium]
MNKDLLNILSDSKEIDQQKLLDYLQNNVSEEERHEIEKLFIDEAFESDASEGLQRVSDKSKLPVVMGELNRQLIKKLSSRRKRNNGKKPLNLMIPVITTIILLLLALMFFLYIRRHIG